ncbi:MAG: hypothetical protein MUO76_22695 [Anaerolineaceae bacterium]|nr:hypothetical protein [Anaerolineaceae bacterium]
MEISFSLLPARPMHTIEVDMGRLEEEKLAKYLCQQIASLDPDAVVRIKTQGEFPPEARQVLSAAYLRGIAPPSMKISIARRYRPILGRGESGRR